MVNKDIMFVAVPQSVIQCLENRSGMTIKNYFSCGRRLRCVSFLIAA
jgi:hypothetical protein